MDACHYELHELIGEGSFGKVYKARFRQNNHIVAYKVISKTGRRPSEVCILRNECEIQKNLRHPNIIRMLGAFETEAELIVVTEFAQKDLCRLLAEVGIFQENKARTIIADLVSALHYLHSNKILHRDLKPQNVLLDYNGSAKLCDFGFARVLGNDSAVFTSIKGTPLYMAPELVNEFPYDYSADLWSLGCISYELVTGYPPYSTTSILHLIKMIRVEPVKWPTYLTEVCLSFLKALLQKNPTDRLTWPHLLYHPFININAQFLCSPPAASSGFMDVNTTRYMPEPIAPMPQSFHIPNGYNQFINFGSNFVSPFAAPQNCEPIPLKLNDGMHQCDKMCESDSEDIEFNVQKEEWLEFLRITIRSIICDGEIDVLTEEHSLKMIMNAFNGCNACPVVVTTIAKLLSLPFVYESEINLTSVRQTYGNCEVIKDLLTVVRKIIEKKQHSNKNACYDAALQHLFLLICNLVFADRKLLQQFFNVCISLSVFQMIKNCLSVRMTSDPFSVVKYVVALFLRVYILIPQSRQLIAEAFENSLSEFHSILRDCGDVNTLTRLCTLINILSCTQPTFLKKTNGIQNLIDDITYLRSNSSLNTLERIEGTIEVLRNLKRRQQLAP